MSCVGSRYSPRRITYVCVPCKTTHRKLYREYRPTNKDYNPKGPRCPKCQEDMVRWMNAGGLPKWGDKFWKRVQVVDLQIGDGEPWRVLRYKDYPGWRLSPPYAKIRKHERRYAQGSTRKRDK